MVHTNLKKPVRKMVKWKGMRKHPTLLFVVIVGCNIITFICLLIYDGKINMDRYKEELSSQGRTPGFPQNHATTQSGLTKNDSSLVRYKEELSSQGRTPGFPQNHATKQSGLTKNDSSLAVVIKDFGLKDVGNNDVYHQSANKDVIKFSKKVFKPITSTLYKGVYIFTSVGRQTTENASRYDVAINIWQASTFNERKSFCCYLFKDGKINKMDVYRKSSFLNNSLTSVQVTCRTPAADKPLGVTSVYDDDVCPISIDFYVKIKYPRRCSVTFCFAVCAKIAYGTVNPEIIIEWMEYSKYMGVSYVVTFTYNLTTKVMDVLKYYEKVGILEVLPFDYPSKDSPARNIGDKNIASWTDEKLTVYDCHDRLRNFDYVAVVDFDEFLVPRRGTVQDLLVNLSKQNPQAASFTFMSEIHALDWGSDANASISLIPRFTRHTEALKDRPKVVHLPKYVEPGGIATHGVLPKSGYKRIGVLPQQATLKHYRPCRQEWLQQGSCISKRSYTDRRMAEIFLNINDKISAVKKQILDIT